MLNRDACRLCRIDLSHVSVTRGGQEVLHDVNMHIHCGQLTMLIGQNGAGKTTLIRALLGEIPYQGSIRHEDGDQHEVPHLTKGYVPQQLEFDRDMPVTVRDLMAASFSKRPVWTGISNKTDEKIMKALERVHAEGLIMRPLGRCSGGELQRILLALAMEPAPDLLVLDEPISGVDENGQRLFLDTVNELRFGAHMAILMVSHDLKLVHEYADQVILLDRSVLVQGPPQVVFGSAEFGSVFGKRRERAPLWK